MTAATEALVGAPPSENLSAACSHCLLPVGRLGQQRSVNGEARLFCCYGCCIAYQVRHGVSEEHEAAWLLVRFGVGSFLAMNIMLFSLLLYSGNLDVGAGGLRQAVHVILGVFATLVLAILGSPFFGGAWQAARGGRMTTDSLVSLGALGAYGYSVYAVVISAEAVYFDTATMVLVLFTLGRYLEALGRARALRSLAPLLAAETASATVVEDGTDSIRPAREVVPGTVVRLRPGERAPVDGTVIEGASTCDESVLTGQAAPQAKRPGSSIFAGSLNGSGQLLLRTTAAGGRSSWGRHARFVREALAHRSLVGELADRAAAVFVPAVVLLAGATLLYWSRHAPLDEAAMTALAVLVVACPCALGLAAPLASALGLAQALERGILLRGGGVFERLARLRAVAFDKTGTLSQDALHLAGCQAVAGAQADLLRRAAGLAQASDHPVARAILAAAAARGITPLAARRVGVRSGAGLVGVFDDGDAALGSAALMAGLGLPLPSALAKVGQDARTTAFVAWGGAVRGRLTFGDPPLDKAAAVVTALRQRGLATALLSGDRPAMVERTAAAVGIEIWRGGLAPMDKVAFLRDWAKLCGPAAMVGDGLNDGPVLAVAGVGIAVGGASDLARESADVILPEGRLDTLPWLIDHARRVRRHILTNILWALAYNGAALTLAVCGLLQPILAAALMAGSSLLVVANSLLVGRSERHDTGDVAT